MKNIGQGIGSVAKGITSYSLGNIGEGLMLMLNSGF